MVADATAAARCQVDCWREAYGALVEPARLDAVCDLDRRVARWQRFATLAPPRLLAYDAEQVVGFVGAGPGRDDDLDLSTELYALYVRAARYGTGLGAALVDRAIGDAPAYLWMFEGNTRAERFYAKHGFSADGARKHDTVFGLDEVRLRR